MRVIISCRRRRPALPRALSAEKKQKNTPNEQTPKNYLLPPPPPISGSGVAEKRPDAPFHSATPSE